MEIAHILEELAYDMGELPREAIEAAILRREQITPFLLNILEEALSDIDTLIEHESYQGHTYALYLLAQFREKRAFPLILKILSLPGEVPHTITGDILTEDMSRILASLYSGDLDAIKSIIENPLLNEYARAACQTCLVILVGLGFHSREEILSYFKSLFYKIKKEKSFFWDNLVSCCCDLYPDTVLPEIKETFNRGLIEEKFSSIQDVESILMMPKERYLLELFENIDLIEDTVTEMEKWVTPSLL